MPSGYKVNGVDLDAIFAARSGATPGSATGYKVAGVDLNQRFFASSGTEDRRAGNTGYKVNGVDLRVLFRDIAYVPPSGSGPTITDQPDTGTHTEGDNVTLTVAATGTGTLTYQWKKSGVTISGATATTLSFTPIARADAGSYTCEITDDNGTLASSAAVLTVQYLPAITAQPAPQAVLETDTASFSVTVTAGVPTPTTYQWQRNPGGSGSWANITGGKYSGYATTALSFSAALADDGDTFRCVVSNAVGPVTSSHEGITVDGLFHPAVAADPNHITATAGDGPLALQCSIVAGSGTNYFAWYKNDVLVVGPRVGNMSATQDQHVFNPIETTDAGTWDCRISTSYSLTANSLDATVSVTPTNPTISSQPANVSAAEDSLNALQCTASVRSAEGPVYFRWYQGGVAITARRAGNLSGTQDQHVFTMGAAQEGSWVCIVSTDFGGSTTSSVATVTMVP